MFETPQSPEPIKLNTLGVGDKIHMKTRNSTHVVMVLSLSDGGPVGQVIETTNEKYKGRRGTITNDTDPFGLKFHLSPDQFTTYPIEIHVEKANQTGGLIGESRERYGVL